MEQHSVLPDTPVPRANIQIQGSLDEAILQASPKGVTWNENKSALTPTSGFLASGFTHTLNPYVGCSNAGSLCGTFCYAQHFKSITKIAPGHSTAPSETSARRTSGTMTGSSIHAKATPSPFASICQASPIRTCPRKSSFA